MRAYAQTGSMKAAAAQLGVKENTAKNHCSNVYSKLGAFGLVDALRILGWLHVPED